MNSFREGEWVLITTQKGKTWLIRLQKGDTFSCHLGSIRHSDIMERKEGDFWETSSGTKLFFFRPAMTDFLFHIKRRTQIMYPKDIGAILCYGDIRPGMTILESGVGSGALTLFLLAFLGKDGQVVSVEKRPEFAELAKNNVRKVFGDDPPSWQLVIADIESPPFSVTFDRVILDLPEPWKAVESVSTLLKNGGILISLSPQVAQLQLIVKALRKRGFRCFQIFEILKRDWFIDEQRTRPVDRMISHTGFLLFARKTADSSQSSDENSGS
ncbi:MAG: tRNA (adenine-N1)-methyltransferase [Syntrophobacterales bacterium]|nr:tRNA (adenine-N1)-methyltransferase [Syntrophobacterales bacterium]